MGPNDWANALDHFWGDLEPGSRALLMLEKSSLVEVAGYVGVQFDNDDEAEEDFLAAVKCYLGRRCHRTWDPEPYVPGRPPRFLLQLAIQVYAASKMAADPDGHFTDRAYHPRLEELIGEQLSKRRFNLNEQADYHQKLWRERLMEWVSHKQLELTLPEDGSRYRNHVSLPLSQMVLRASDLQQLPVFFCEAKFEPVYVAADESLDHSNLNRIRSELGWRRYDSHCFSKWARTVLQDDYKFEVAVHQIEEALRTWDGRLWLSPSRRRENGTTKKSHWLWLSISPGRYGLKGWRGRSLPSATRVSQSELGKLFSGVAVDEFGLAMHDGIALFRYEEDDAAFKDAPYIDAGDRGLLVVGPHFKGNWNQLLSGDAVFRCPKLYASEESSSSEQIRGIPSGCMLLEFQVVERLPAIESVPEIWRPFLRLPPAGLSLAGGLRVGRRERFVVGAGPRLKISGNTLPRFVTVDGEKVPVTSRTLQLDQFSARGTHEIVAIIDGRTISKRFEVINPTSAVPPGMPERGWWITAEKWPEWVSDGEAASEASTVVETKDSQPRLFGVMSQGLGPAGMAKMPVEDARLTAIRLLVGMPSVNGMNTQCSHPLVRYLLTKRLQRDAEEGRV